MGVEGDTGVSQAQHMKGNLKQCHLVQYVLLVTLTPPVTLTTSRTRLSDSLGLNNTFYCLVEPLQNIHFTYSSKIDSSLLQYVFECHVSWCSTYRSADSAEFA
jgi:hypothetical protein